MGTFASCTTICSPANSGSLPPTQVFPAVAKRESSASEDSPVQKVPTNPAVPSDPPRRWVSGLGQDAARRDAEKQRGGSGSAPPPAVAALQSEAASGDGTGSRGTFSSEVRPGLTRSASAHMKARMRCVAQDDGEAVDRQGTAESISDKLPEKLGYNQYKRQGTTESTSSLKDRAESAGMMSLELDFDSLPISPTRDWSDDQFGTMLHKDSGVRVSPEKGIQVDGVDYRLSPADIDILDDTLGSGSGGVVRVGRLKASGVVVAIKTLKVGSDDDKREQMLKEIRGLVQAEGCPYLIQWYSGFADLANSSVNVVVELMDRGSLADLRKRINGRAVPAEHVACIAAQVLRGLHFLQMRELLHRDIKPENILHTRAGRVKLTDFGISKELGSLTTNLSSTFVGTATYMAPERASGGTYSYESDVWSAGMVIYELAAGQYPFNTGSFPELFLALCEGPEPRLKASPPVLCDLVSRCLTRDPAQRPSAVALISQEIVAGLSEKHLKAFSAWLAPPDK